MWFSREKYTYCPAAAVVPHGFIDGDGSRRERKSEGMGFNEASHLTACSRHTTKNALERSKKIVILLLKSLPGSFFFLFPSSVFPFWLLEGGSRRRRDDFFIWLGIYHGGGKAKRPPARHLLEKKRKARNRFPYMSVQYLQSRCVFLPAAVGPQVY